MKLGINFAFFIPTPALMQITHRPLSCQHQSEGSHFKRKKSGGGGSPSVPDSVGGGDISGCIQRYVIYPDLVIQKNSSERINVSHESGQNESLKVSLSEIVIKRRKYRTIPPFEFPSQRGQPIIRHKTETNVRH